MNSDLYFFYEKSRIYYEWFFYQKGYYINIFCFNVFLNLLLIFLCFLFFFEFFLLIIYFYFALVGCLDVQIRF